MVPKAAQIGSSTRSFRRKEEEEKDQNVFVPRKRMRYAQKRVLGSDDEENEEDKDVEGGFPLPIHVARPPKRPRRRSEAAVSDSEGDTASFALGPSEERRDKSPDRLVPLPTTYGLRRSNRVTKPSRSYFDLQDADAEDDCNKTLDHQDLTIFEDDPYAEEQTDEEEYESDLEMEEHEINQEYQVNSLALTAKPKTTSRSKRPGTGKLRKPNRPREPDTFARLHMGSTSIPFCLQDTSTQRRSLWASRLCACLKSYQDQCKNTYEQHGNYEEAMEVLADQQTGPLAKTVASLLLKKDLDIEKVVQQTLLPHYSQAATDILGLETVTVETLLQLPRVSDEDLYTRGDYLKLIDLDGWQQYWGSATGSQSSTMFASMAQSPTYSPQSSPPPPNTWQRDIRRER
ncbi:hypothetical protein EKO04_005875 [Ascochyta lentis]|uniref:Uncharacterized protein n=1 Tax=Ascochyta lentis TaxID=205686 RepID=A0A8H7J0Y9_9PLEO|nr:hypothetical protein EKO04_005875 [Ascochyta lentis]